MSDGRLWVAMVNDRHHDPTAHVFSTPEAAIAFARQHYEDNLPDQLDQAQRHASGIGEQQVEGWLYCAVYSVEDDAVWVYEVTVDVPVGEA